MIEVKNLTKKYGNHAAIEDLTFTVREGKIYGFLGPNGAGKSTTMNIITGCLSATEGTVTIDGHDIFEEPMEAKRLIGYLPEIPPLYPDMTPYEYLSFVARAKGVSRAEIENQVEQVMEQTGILEMKNRLIKNLSKGFRQRVGIAQAMLGDPRVIILDEPTVGLDPLQIIEIRDLIKELGEHRTVILSSHILSEVSAVCDEVLIIANGHLVAADSIANLSSHVNESAVIRMCVKAQREALEQVLLQLDEARRVTVTEDSANEGCCVVEIESDSKLDLRERAFRLLAGEGYIILSSTMETSSLEDTFLRLTGEEESQTEAAVNDEDVDDDDDDNHDDNTDDGDGSAYKPQFTDRD